VNIGMCTVAGAFFLQLHHSKQLADMFFGKIEDLFGKVRYTLKQSKRPRDDSNHSDRFELL